MGDEKAERHGLSRVGLHVGGKVCEHDLAERLGQRLEQRTEQRASAAVRPRDLPRAVPAHRESKSFASPICARSIEGRAGQGDREKDARQAGGNVFPTTVQPPAPRGISRPSGGPAKGSRFAESGPALADECPTARPCSPPAGQWQPGATQAPVAAVKILRSLPCRGAKPLADLPRNRRTVSDSGCHKI